MTWQSLNSLEDLSSVIIARCIIEFINSRRNPSDEDVLTCKLELDSYIAPIVWKNCVIRSVLKEIHKFSSSLKLPHCIDLFKFVFGRQVSSLCLIGEADYCSSCNATMNFGDFARAFCFALFQCDCTCCTNNLLNPYPEVCRVWPSRMGDILTYGSTYYGHHLKFLHLGEMGDNVIKCLPLLPNLKGLSFKLTSEKEKLSENFTELVTSLVKYCTDLSYFSFYFMGREIERLKDLKKLKSLKRLEIITELGDEEIAVTLICELPNLEEFGWNSENLEFDLERIQEKLKKVCSYGNCFEKILKWLAPVRARLISNTSHLATLFPTNLPLEQASFFDQDFLHVEGDFGLVSHVIFDHTRLETLLPFFRCNGSKITLINIVMEQMMLTVDNLLSVIESCPHLESISFIGCIFMASGQPDRELPITSLRKFVFLPEFFSTFNAENKIVMLQTIIHSSPRLETVKVNLGSITLDDGTFSTVFPETLASLRSFHLEGTDLRLSETSLRRVVSMSNTYMEVGYVNLWFGIFYQWRTPTEVRNFLERNRTRIKFKECLSKRSKYMRAVWIQEINEAIEME